MLSQEAKTKEELGTALLDSKADTVWVSRKVLIEMVGLEAAQELLPALPKKVAVNRKTTLSKCDQTWLNALSNTTE